jgi:hypothetical protein
MFHLVINQKTLETLARCLDHGRDMLDPDTYPTLEGGTLPSLVSKGSHL